MAPARPQRKPAAISPWAIALALVMGLNTPIAIAAFAQRVVSDWHTGLALYGYDPVAYFTDAAPLMGRPEFEYALGGVIWRFRNEGNRAQFIAHTEVYMPGFGGYDPIAVARGVARPGHPALWLIDHERLYVFADTISRAAFAADPRNAVTAAEARWPSVRRGLGP